jgi:peptide subunit release factor RF-3
VVKDQEKQMVGQKKKNNGEEKQRVREKRIEENWMEVERERGIEKKNRYRE